MVLTKKRAKPEQEAWKNMKNLVDYANYVFTSKMDTQKPNTGSEGPFHFHCKSIGAYIISEINHHFAAEVIVNNSKNPGRIDLIDLNEKVIIEFETSLTREGMNAKTKKYFTSSYIRDIIFIDLKKVPRDFDGAYRYLRERIKKVQSDEPHIDGNEITMDDMDRAKAAVKRFEADTPQEIKGSLPGEAEELKDRIKKLKSILKVCWDGHMEQELKTKEARLKALLKK